MMYKHFLPIAVICLLASSPVLRAQNLTFDWAERVGGTTTEEVRAVTTDLNGNIYTTGSFSGTVDFNPGSTGASFTSSGMSDIFIQKQDNNGNLIWVKHMGGTGRDFGTSMVTDAHENVYTVGFFTHTVDFDPNSGSTPLTTAGISDIFIQKLDATGSLVWVKRVGGTSLDFGSSIAIDTVGNLLITGYFQTTVDFDPGVGVSNLNSPGNYDAFVQKLDSNGNFLWVKQIGNTFHRTEAEIVSTDMNGNVYVAGNFENSADFESPTGSITFTSSGSSDLFIQKFTSNGSPLWAKRIGGIRLDKVTDMTTDSKGNIYCIGNFINTVDFDPGSGSNNLTAMGGSNTFILKLDSNGIFSWVKQMGSGTEEYAIDSDSHNNLYITGGFRSMTDFDPGIGVYNLTPNGGSDIFIQKLDSNGSFIATIGIGGTSGDEGTNITVDQNDNLYSTGSFSGTVDFDPGIGLSNLVSIGSSDIFIQKLSQSNLTTNLKEFSVNDFKVYPNPTAENLTLEFDTFQENLILQLYSISGQLLKTEFFQGSKLLNFEINQPSGMYLLEILGETGNRSVMKVAKE